MLKTLSFNFLPVCFDFELHRNEIVHKQTYSNSKSINSLSRSEERCGVNTWIVQIELASKFSCEFEQSFPTFIELFNINRKKRK